MKLKQRINLLHTFDVQVESVSIGDAEIRESLSAVERHSFLVSQNEIRIDWNRLRENH